MMSAVRVDIIGSAQSAPGSRRPTRPGYGLIDTAIALVILGLVSGGLSLLLIESWRSQAQNRTMSHIQTTFDAVLAHGIRTGTLPCPAAFDARNGMPLANCMDFPADGVLIGSVPWASLGIPPRLSLDGWGRRMTYVVSVTAALAGPIGDPNRRLCDTDAETDLPHPWPEADAIRISGGAGTPTDQQGPTQVMLLISHGANGVGARLASGQPFFGADVPTAGSPEWRNRADADVIYEGVGLVDPASRIFSSTAPEDGSSDDVVRMWSVNRVKADIGCP